MRAVLIERASLEAAIIRVRHFEPRKAPLTAEVVADALHEIEFRLLILWPVVVWLGALLQLLLQLAFDGAILLIVRQFHAARRIQLHLEYMNRSMIAAASESLALHVKADRVDFGALRAPPDLLQWLAGLSRVYADHGALVTGSREQSSLVVEADSGESAIVRWYLERLVLFVHVHAHVSLLRIGCREHRVFRVRVQRYQAFVIRTRLDCVNQPQFFKIVNVRAQLEHHDDSKRIGKMISEL